MEDLEIWYSDQSLYATLIDRHHDPQLRARIRRNAYDPQSCAVVEAWTAEGWAEIHRVPITACGIWEYSYVYGTWDRDQYVGTVNGKKGMPFWTEVIEADVRSLIAYGRRFYTAAVR